MESNYPGRTGLWAPARTSAEVASDPHSSAFELDGISLTDSATIVALCRRDDLTHSMQRRLLGLVGTDDSGGARGGVPGVPTDAIIAGLCWGRALTDALLGELVLEILPRPGVRNAHPHLHTFLAAILSNERAGSASVIAVAWGSITADPEGRPALENALRRKGAAGQVALACAQQVPTTTWANTGRVRPEVRLERFLGATGEAIAILTDVESCADETSGTARSGGGRVNSTGEVEARVETFLGLLPAWESGIVELAHSCRDGLTLAD